MAKAIYLDAKTLPAFLDRGLRFRVIKGGWTRNVTIGELPVESIARILEYGAQRFYNDRCGGSGVSMADSKERIAAINAKMDSGEWGVRRAGGGAKLSEYDAEMRVVLKGRLEKAFPNMKAAERDEYVTKRPRDAVAKLAAALCRAKGVATPEGVASIIKQMTDKIDSTVKENIARRNTDDADEFTFPDAPESDAPESFDPDADPDTETPDESPDPDESLI